MIYDEIPKSNAAETWKLFFNTRLVSGTKNVPLSIRGFSQIVKNNDNYGHLSEQYFFQPSSGFMVNSA